MVTRTLSSCQRRLFCVADICAVALRSLSMKSSAALLPSFSTFDTRYAVEVGALPNPQAQGPTKDTALNTGLEPIGRMNAGKAAASEEGS